jgi:hypothetical protein
MQQEVSQQQIFKMKRKEIKSWRSKRIICKLQQLHDLKSKRAFIYHQLNIFSLSG